MTQTPITVNYEITEILKRLEIKIDRIEEKVTKLEIGQAEIKGDVKALDERLSGQIKAVDERLSGQIKAVDERLSGQIKVLDEKVSGIDKRVSNQEFLNRTTVGGLILVIIGGIVKILIDWFSMPRS